VVRASCQQLFDLSTMTAGQWLGNFAAAESWRHHLGGGEPGFLIANTWTLCYEEQFYVVTGLLLALAARRFFQAAAVVTAAVFVAWCASQGLNLQQHGFFWDGHWLMFAAGILVYRALAYNQPRGRSKAIGVFLLAMIVGASQKVLAREHFDRHMGEYLFVAGGFAIALLFLRRWDRQIAELSVFKPLLWVGQRSYSIYLTHYLVVVVVSSCLAYGGLQSEWQVAAIVVPVCLLLSLPIAMLFYELVERRFLNKPV
jgi:peptidoglycan/LPS O-acetylase OafA/YrhL